MIRLKKALKAWKTPGFNQALKTEIESLDAGQLPLQQGLSMASYASEDKLSTIILASNDDAEFIHAKAGIFFTGLIAGCSCADDPTPNNEYNEYCEIQIDINKQTAKTNISLVNE